jgi:two-component system cell cycle response regulator DivK
MSDQTWILLVEDNEANRMLACAVLERDGLEVRWASTAEAAGELLVDSHPALILMDIQLPGMDGLSFTRQLKADRATRSIPVVALTAHAMEADREIAMAAGCDGYIFKPIDVKLFAALVRAYMSKPERPKSAAPAIR